MTTTMPAIRILAADYDRLVALAEGAASRAPETAFFLQGELDRAHLVIHEGVAAVQMGSRVRYRDHGTERVHDVRLVYPTEADIADGRVSILSPVGAALIGLEEGASISWRDNAGQEKTLTVLEVD